MGLDPSQTGGGYAVTGGSGRSTQAESPATTTTVKPFVRQDALAVVPVRLPDNLGLISPTGARADIAPNQSPASQAIFARKLAAGMVPLATSLPQAAPVPVYGKLVAFPAPFRGVAAGQNPASMAAPASRPRWPMFVGLGIVVLVVVAVVRS